jgi:chromosome segregation ATPase
VDSVTFQIVLNLDGPELEELLQIVTATSRIEGKLNQLLQLQEQIRMKIEDFQARLDTINTNTTASAAAAQSAATAAGNAATAAQTIKGTLDDLRTQIANAGLDATQEAALLASLDSAAAGTDAVRTAAEGIKAANTALDTYLQQVAAGPTEPAPVQVPEAIA